MYCFCCLSNNETCRTEIKGRESHISCFGIKKSDLILLFGKVLMKFIFFLLDYIFSRIIRVNVKKQQAPIKQVQSKLSNFNLLRSKFNQKPDLSPNVDLTLRNFNFTIAIVTALIFPLLKHKSK